ncbi:MAG: TauD/TfdA family dioxygenase [Gammaproteobacteria bacterium]|nr:TauD/TfdA family dioxygenase [Gammaproteobacteria bacterium]
MAIHIEPTQATLGAVVTGVRIAALADGEWRAIEDAFHQHGLLIFPGQHPSHEEQLAFARRFGDIEVLAEGMTTVPIANLDPQGKLLAQDSQRMQLLKGNEGWHTDSSYMHLASKAAVLSAHVLPSAGGETQWADARAAYDALDEATRARIADLVACHDYFRSQAKIGHQAEVGSGYGFFAGEKPLRPLVKVHPVTGRKTLYVGRHASSIVGLPDDEAEALIARLNEFITSPPRVYTHHWQVGDLVVWDNRCLLHRARPYDYNETRIMMHTRIKGDPRTESALNAPGLAA